MRLRVKLPGMGKPVLLTIDAQEDFHDVVSKAVAKLGVQRCWEGHECHLMVDTGNGLAWVRSELFHTTSFINITILPCAFIFLGITHKLVHPHSRLKLQRTSRRTILSSSSL